MSHWLKHEYSIQYNIPVVHFNAGLHMTKSDTCKIIRYTTPDSELEYTKQRHCLYVNPLKVHMYSSLVNTKYEMTFERLKDILLQILD